VPEVQQVITHDDLLPKLQAQEDVQCTLHNTKRNQQVREFSFYLPTRWQM
jgi:hypothetical protein